MLNKELSKDEKVDINEFIAAEEELSNLKKELGIKQKTHIWKKILNLIVDHKEKRLPVRISKKKYCLLALFGGIFGIHQFAVKKYITGVIYLLVSFTGLSFAMSILDIWYAAFLKGDEDKRVII
jgi:hypothetical protein